MTDSAPYCRELGLVVEALDANAARLRLPYRDGNSNPGKALHGGVAASLIDIGGALVSLAGFDSQAALAHGSIDVSVGYLAAAIGEEIVADARALRRGKEITYVEVDVATTAGKAIAKGIVVHRVVPAAVGRAFGEPPNADDVPPKPASDMGRAFMKVPFIARLGMKNEGFEDGVARVRMPFAEANTIDGRRLHEGAILALMDTTGALSSWSITGIDFRYKASTVALHGQFIAAAEGEDLISLSRTARRDEEIFWNSVTVVGATSKRLVARGDVLYRIVVPKEGNG